MSKNGLSLEDVFSVTLGMLLFLHCLIRRGVSIRFCGNLLVVCLTMIGISAGISNGGMQAPAVLVFILNPVVGFFCIGTSGARIAFVFSILGILILLTAEHYSLIQPVNNPEKYTLYKSVIYFFGTFCAYAIGAAYEHSRQISEKVLAEISVKALQASKMSSLGEMASGIAHEINNPLTIINGWVAQLQRQIDSGNTDPEKIKSTLIKIENTTDRIARIVKGLKTFSRNDELDLMERVSVATIIEDSLALCKERFRNHEIDLRVDCQPNVFVECRATQISQVILNLLGNAHDAVETLPEKWVSLQVSSDENTVKISVTDSGNGIPLKVVEKMMQPFFTTKDVGKGTGLGLSISLGIVQDHHGLLMYDVKSPNTRFLLELPNKSSNEG